MPEAGDVIHNPVHGETMRFLETGQDLQVELTVLPQASGPPAHIHPHAAESFQVTSGAIRLKAARERQVLTAGESFTVSPGMAHTFWNHTDTPAVVLTTWKPGLEMAEFIDAWFRLARDGHLNDRGMASPLQIAVLFDAYLDSIAFPRLPLAMQRGIFGLLSRIGRRRGLTKHGGPPKRQEINNPKPPSRVAQYVPILAAGTPRHGASSEAYARWLFSHSVVRGGS